MDAAIIHLEAEIMEYTKLNRESNRSLFAGNYEESGSILHHRRTPGHPWGSGGALSSVNIVRLGKRGCLS
jgi:hypothetical protein